MKKTIMVTNDDGIHGAGLRPLVDALRPLGTVCVVVPDQERSGASHAITLHKPFRAHELEPGMYLANGTPADCVKYGVRKLLAGKVDLVVSGINSGPNLGNDVIYSGTVAGAREGAMLDVPSMAVSVAELAHGDFALAAVIAQRIARNMLAGVFPRQIFLNVNVPRNMKGLKLTAVGDRIYDQNVASRTDPRGRKYYWLVGRFVAGVHREGSDITAVESGYASVTPLLVDQTATEAFDAVRFVLGDDAAQPA